MEPESTRRTRTCGQITPGLPCVDGFREDFKPDKDGKIHACRFWTHVAGKDPQSEKIIDHFDCAFAWLPVVILEASQMTRHMTATTQEFRNETNENMKAFGGAMAKAAYAIQELAETQKALTEGVPLPSIENKENNGHDN